ncbi:EF-hand domain-containing protein [Lentibacter algarum]|uniref:EF-hand domain-containing protein n=1 Tax=Lentibacter algarum TaxID=576131 RepID=UPI001C09C14A|nr:EF-hand domain-containing protein [Lentibacter algarum]MBU2982922.1 EF-hand domain-containing protein [Lentibacter algarum]
MTTYNALTRATALAMIVSIAAVGGQAVAAGAKGEGRHMNFEQLDTNSDGKLSQEELKAGGDQRFTQSDSNNDGKITKDEAVAKAGERAGQRFDKMLEKFDADKDGALTQDEIRAGKREARMEKMFKRADTDNDGFISEEEMKNMHEKRGGHRKHGHGHKKND